jgi:hypothetical protein
MKDMWKWTFWFSIAGWVATGALGMLMAVVWWRRKR